MKPLIARPYQLMCLVCRQADGFGDDAHGRNLKQLLAAIRRQPDMPIALYCNVECAYDYQNPGTGDDTPEGALFNMKRDIDILQRLGLTPGATHPVRVLLGRLFRTITATAGICGYATITGAAWQGCPRANSGCYERGIAAGITALISPHDNEAMARAKQQSVAAMQAADTLEIRPHHLMCMTCFHAGEASLAPIAADNLFEAIDLLQRHPDMPVQLVPVSSCMICPPCHAWHLQRRQCVGNCGLRDQKKDLDVLQKTGLQYGDVLPGRLLLRRLYAAVLSTMDVCGCGDGIARAPEWDGCGREGRDAYVKGRAAGLGVPGVTVDDAC